MNVTAQKALDKVKIQLMSKADSVFFTVVCFSLIHKWDDTIPTAATNGKYIKFNPDFFLSLTPDERLFLVLHETLHVAFMHMARLHTYNPLKWNYAADYVINDLLIKRGYKMPKGGLHNRDYADMSVKQVYDLIPEPPPDDPDFISDLEPGSSDPAEQAAAERALNEIVIRAATQAKMAGQTGSIPGEIQFYLDKLLNPKLPWGTILRKYMKQYSKTDYSMRKPNRRFFPRHYLPSLHSTSMASLAVAVDTSGSVSDSDFLQFMSEVDSMLRIHKPEKISLIQFDWNIKSVDTLKRVNDIKTVKFTGRGGTNTTEVMNWVNDNKPNVLIIFTDGYFTPADIPVKSDVIWVIHNNPRFTSDVGKVIHYEV